MENVWRDDPVTDGQQGAIRFINANLGMNEHPRTKGEAADYIKAYKEKAEAAKNEREQMKRERLEREKLCDPIIERLSKSAKPANERPRDKVKFDAEKLFSLAMDAGFRNFTELARKAFPDGHPGEGYILDRIRDYDSTMSKRWLEMICATLGCALEEIMPTEPTKQMEIALDAAVDEPVENTESENGRPLDKEQEDKAFVLVTKALRLNEEERRAYVVQAAYLGIHPIECVFYAVVKEAWRINEKLADIFGEVKDDAD